MTDRNSRVIHMSFVMYELGSKAGESMDIKQWNKGKWRFNDIHNLGFPYYHIHPYKQKIAKEIADNLPPSVKNLIVFGSSVGTWHKWWKDIDICVIGADKLCMEALTDCIKIKNDLICYENLDALITADRGLAYQIKKGGVMIYEKG